MILNEKEVAMIKADILEQQRRGNEIISYWHCEKCCDEDMPQHISVGWTAKGIQVWCETHNLNVQHIDLRGQKIAVAKVKDVA